jgi:hypothetical protein
MQSVLPLARRAALALSALLLGGCTTTSLVLGAVGVATDTSIPLAIARHVHEKLTDGDPVPCPRLDSVQRALSPRCGEFVPGSLDARDVHTVAMQMCPLAAATRDPRLWPVLPELLAKGAAPERCGDSPLAALAQADPCPDFGAASPEARRALHWLASADARALQHDVVRMLSCPQARAAGLSAVLDEWQAAGALQPERLGFGLLGALHPDYLDTPFARAREADGHTALAGLGAYQGRLAPGFEEALRGSHWAAIDWWLARRPELADAVPPRDGAQLPWRPLARVLVPSFLRRPEDQAAMLRFLMARGADPSRRMPFDATRSVTAYARQLHSPLVAVLEEGPPARAPALPAPLGGPLAYVAPEAPDGRAPGAE